MKTLNHPMVLTALVLALAGCGKEQESTPPPASESAAEAESAKQQALAEAEAAKKQAEAQVAKLLAEAEAVKKKAEAEAARTLAEAEAIKKQAQTPPPPAADKSAEQPAKDTGKTKAETPPAPGAQTAEKPAEPAPAPERKAPLEVQDSCKFSLQWRDEGSGGKRDLAVYGPHVPAGFRSVGSYGQSDYNEPFGCVTVVRALLDKLPNGKAALIAPSGYEQIWTDKGSGADMDGSLWQPVSSDPDYVCLGSVAQPGYSPPQIESYACVHRCLAKQVSGVPPMWTDEGTGANSPVAVYQLLASKVIHAVPRRSGSEVLHDLDPGGVCN